MKKVLITGGAGFIGSHLADELLTQGYQVDLLDNFSRGARDRTLEELCNRGAKTLDRDLLVAEGLAGLPSDYTYIFHFAAIIGVSNVLHRPYAVLRDNVLMLERVLEFCRSQQRLERLVFASTSEVYAGTLQYFTLPIPTPETTPIALTDLAHPRTSYMLSKLYGEAMCQQAGIPFTIIRPHNVYGPRMGMAHVIPELLKKARQTPAGGALEVYSVAHRRTFCYIDDAVQLIRRAAEADACLNATINIGNQAPEISMGELAEHVIKTIGKPLTIKPLPETPGSPARRCPDMAHTTALTGYRAQIGLADGIQKTYAWYLPTLD